MYKNIKLNKKNIELFRKINIENNKFNDLNKDFFNLYDQCNFARQLVMRRKVYLLKSQNDLTGYLWTNSNGKGNCVLNSFNVLEKENELEPYKILITSLNKENDIRYYCKNNGYNFDILEKLGFEKKQGKLKLRLDNINWLQTEANNDIEFVNCRKKLDTELRCKIQNEIFNSASRNPLTVDDISFDENQPYYFEQGAVFVKKDNNHIGYGQIIFENNKPFIVNFGILEKYRGHGYGRVLLQYFIKIAKYHNFNEIYIKVNASNKIALNLYMDSGFKKYEEKYYFELNRK